MGGVSKRFIEICGSEIDVDTYPWEFDFVQLDELDYKKIKELAIELGWEKETEMQVTD